MNFAEAMALVLGDKEQQQTVLDSQKYRALGWTDDEIARYRGAKDDQ